MYCNGSSMKRVSSRTFHIKRPYFRSINCKKPVVNERGVPKVITITFGTASL